MGSAKNVIAALDLQCRDVRRYAHAVALQPRHSRRSRWRDRRGTSSTRFRNVWRGRMRSRAIPAAARPMIIVSGAVASDGRCAPARPALHVSTRVFRRFCHAPSASA